MTQPTRRSGRERVALTIMRYPTGWPLWKYVHGLSIRIMRHA